MENCCIMIKVFQVLDKSPGYNEHIYMLHLTFNSSSDLSYDTLTYY